MDVSQKNLEAQRNGLRYLLDPRFKIYFFVPFKREELEDASPLRLYSNTLMESAGLHLLAAKLPADIRELSSDWATIAMYRSSGIVEHTIQPIYLDAFEDCVRLLKERPFRCVLSDERTVDAVDATLARHSEPWLHLSVAPGKDKLSPVNMTWSEFAFAMRDVLGSAEGALHEFALSVFEGATEGNILEPNRPLQNVPRMHGVTAMNEFAVTTLGSVESEAEPLLPGDKLGYETAILKSIDEVIEHRRWLATGARIRYRYKLCLAVPSLLNHFYGNGFSKDSAKKRESPELHRLALSMVRQETYTFESDARVIAAMTTPEGRSLIRLSQLESQIFVTSLALFAARNLAPVLRLEPKLNKLRPQLARVASLSRGENPHRIHKLNVAVQELVSGLKKAIRPSYLKRISEQSNDPREGVKLITDLPLEWLPVGKLPLMMAFETSRATATPGNVSFDQVANSYSRHLSVSSFADVLVIRSYTASDPIRNELSQAITNIISEDAPLQVKVKIVDVSTPDEFVDAWNDFRGAVLIFDGHGIDDSESEVGKLVIAGTPVVIWDLKAKLTRSPPIVILSACDTHALDASHATVANSMLMLGATTVLGTFLPINAVYAASFVRRLLIRIAGYLPLVASSNIFAPTTWRSVVTGLQRMQYVTEVMLSLAKNARLDLKDSFDAIQLQANIEINSGEVAWFERFVARLASATDRTPEAMQMLIKKWASIVDVMHYVQLGNPESILILSDDLFAMADPSALPSEDVSAPSQ